MPFRAYFGMVLCAFALTFISTLPLQAQSDVSVTAEVDRSSVSTDDMVVLQITAAGDYQQLGEPQLPFLSGLQLLSTNRSSQFSMVNGVVSSRTVFTYRLVPTSPGTHTIDSIAVIVDGVTHHTQPIAVEVSQGSAPSSIPGSTSMPAAPAPGGLQGQDLFAEADVDNPRPYVGQQIIYSFRFFQAANLFDQPRLEWPGFSGFWTEPLSPNIVYEQEVGGRRYRVTEVRQALFATAADHVSIPPTTLTIPGGIFRDDMVLHTEPVVVDVQPPPPGAPEGFSGAVGQFDITSWTAPQQAKVNEPVTLFIRVQGSGNLATLPDPAAEAENLLPEWRVYDAQTTTNVSQAGDTIQGEKVFERLMVPKSHGALAVPGFQLVFYDPSLNDYRRVMSDPLVVQIAPGEVGEYSAVGDLNEKQEIDAIANDIRHIKPAPSALAAPRSDLLGRPLYWFGWLFPPLAVAGVWAWDQRRRRLSNDAAFARSQRAARVARRRLGEARSLGQADEDAAYAAVARALTDYVGDKFNLSSAGLTFGAIRSTLTDHFVPEEVIFDTLACLDKADSGRFAPSSSVHRSAPASIGTELEVLITDAERLIAELEKSIANRERT